MENNETINSYKAKHTVFFTGVSFLILILVLALLSPNPKDATLYNIFKLLCALGAAGFISGVTGFFFVNINNKIIATEAFAIFLLVFYLYPIYEENEDLIIIDGTHCIFNNSHERQFEAKVKEKTLYALSKGDTLQFLSVNGTISLGFIIGKSDHTGVDRGLFGMSVERYCIEKNVKHGALMYKIGDSNWKPLLMGQRIISSATQVLQFNVNDREQGNNDGQYSILFRVNS